MFCRVCASAYLRGGGGGPCRYAGAACVTLVPARRVWHGAAVCVACYVTGLACRLEQHGHTRDGKSATAAAAATFSRVQARSSSSVRPSATCFVRTGCTRSVRSKPGSVRRLELPKPVQTIWCLLPVRQGGNLLSLSTADLSRRSWSKISTKTNKQKTHKQTDVTNKQHNRTCAPCQRPTCPDRAEKKT